MIKVETLSKHYGAKQVLKDIDLYFEQGRVYGIVGSNGAGKTTLFRCMAGLERYEGLVDSDRKPLKNHLGFLPTDPFFMSRMTGREYLRLLCNARNVAIRDFDEKNIFDLPLRQYAATYSTGMKKKLALTAVLLQQNDYFILDEPFNGVDIQSNLIITRLIHRLKELNKTVILSSHIFSTLRETCDEIHLLEAGALVKKVDREAFGELDRALREVTIGDRIEKLELQ